MAKPTVLVVDDEVMIRMAVADYLRTLGYRALEAGTAEDAQDVLRSGEPVAAMFSDVRLGLGITGLELAQWVRGHHPDIRIVLTSGVVGLANAVDGLSDSPLLLKPYDYADLGAALARVLDDGASTKARDRA